MIISVFDFFVFLKVYVLFEKNLVVVMLSASVMFVLRLKLVFLIVIVMFFSVVWFVGSDGAKFFLLLRLVVNLLFFSMDFSEW